MYIDKVSKIPNLKIFKCKKNVSFQVRSRLVSVQVDPFELSLINQKDCPRNLTAGVNIDINDDTISAKAAAGVIRKAGEKLGEFRVQIILLLEHFINSLFFQETV